MRGFEGHGDTAKFLFIPQSSTTSARHNRFGRKGQSGASASALWSLPVSKCHAVDYGPCVLAQDAMVSYEGELEVATKTGVKERQIQHRFFDRLRTMHREWHWTRLAESTVILNS